MFDAKMSDWILPYPSQLPQDYYAKGVQPTPPPTPEVPTETPPTVTIPPDGSAVTFGGAYYGDIPPDSPQNGWLWLDTTGRLFVYMDPGVWSQIATNW
jgi:hypothetical protein